MAYPKKIKYLKPTIEELTQISEFYKTQNLPGHILTTDRKLSKNAAEESEYFILRGQPKIENASLVNEMTHIESELDQFCDLIQTAFSLQENTIQYFKKKMSILANRSGTKFFVIEIENQIAGGCSTFKTELGGTFMFNVATHPSMQGKGIAKEIIAYAAMKNPTPLYIYSHNSVMRKSILPSVGFTSIGTIWCQSVENIKNNIKRL